MTVGDTYYVGSVKTKSGHYATTSKKDDWGILCNQATEGDTYGKNEAYTGHYTTIAAGDDINLEWGIILHTLTVGFSQDKWTGLVVSEYETNNEFDPDCGILISSITTGDTYDKHIGKLEEPEQAAAGHADSDGDSYGGLLGVNGADSLGTVGYTGFYTTTSEGGDINDWGIITHSETEGQSYDKWTQMDTGTYNTDSDFTDDWGIINASHTHTISRDRHIGTPTGESDSNNVYNEWGELQETLAQGYSQDRWTGVNTGSYYSRTTFNIFEDADFSQVSGLGRDRHNGGIVSRYYSETAFNEMGHQISSTNWAAGFNKYDGHKTSDTITLTTFDVYEDVSGTKANSVMYNRLHVSSGLGGIFGPVAGSEHSSVALDWLPPRDWGVGPAAGGVSGTSATTTNYVQGTATNSTTISTTYWRYGVNGVPGGVMNGFSMQSVAFDAIGDPDAAAGESWGYRKDLANTSHSFSTTEYYNNGETTPGYVPTPGDAIYTYSLGSNFDPDDADNNTSFESNLYYNSFGDPDKGYSIERRQNDAASASETESFYVNGEINHTESHSGMEGKTATLSSAYYYDGEVANATTSISYPSAGGSSTTNTTYLFGVAATSITTGTDGVGGTYTTNMVHDWLGRSWFSHTDGTDSQGSTYKEDTYYYQVTYNVGVNGVVNPVLGTDGNPISNRGKAYFSYKETTYSKDAGSGESMSWTAYDVKGKPTRIDTIGYHEDGNGNPCDFLSWAGPAGNTMISWRYDHTNVGNDGAPWHNANQVRIPGSLQIFTADWSYVGMLDTRDSTGLVNKDYVKEVIYKGNEMTITWNIVNGSNLQPIKQEWKYKWNPNWDGQGNGYYILYEIIDGQFGSIRVSTDNSGGIFLVAGNLCVANPFDGLLGSPWAIKVEDDYMNISDQAWNMWDEDRAYVFAEYVATINNFTDGYWSARDDYYIGQEQTQIDYDKKMLEAKLALEEKRDKAYRDYYEGAVIAYIKVIKDNFNKLATSQGTGFNEYVYNNYPSVGSSLSGGLIVYIDYISVILDGNQDKIGLKDELENITKAGGLKEQALTNVRDFWYTALNDWTAKKETLIVTIDDLKIQLDILGVDTSELDNFKDELDSLEDTFGTESDYSTLVEGAWDKLIAEYEDLIYKLQTIKDGLVTDRNTLQAALDGYSSKIDQAKQTFASAVSGLVPDGDLAWTVSGVLMYEKKGTSLWGHTGNGKADAQAYADALKKRNSDIQSAVADLLGAFTSAYSTLEGVNNIDIGASYKDAKRNFENAKETIKLNRVETENYAKLVSDIAVWIEEEVWFDAIDVYDAEEFNYNDQINMLNAKFKGATEIGVDLVNGEAPQMVYDRAKQIIDAHWNEIQTAYSNVEGLLVDNFRPGSANAVSSALSAAGAIQTNAISNITGNTDSLMTIARGAVNKASDTFNTVVASDLLTSIDVAKAGAAAEKAQKIYDANNAWYDCIASAWDTMADGIKDNLDMQLEVIIHEEQGDWYTFDEVRQYKLVFTEVERIGWQEIKYIVTLGKRFGKTVEETEGKNWIYTSYGWPYTNTNFSLPSGTYGISNQGGPFYLDPYANSSAPRERPFGHNTNWDAISLEANWSHTKVTEYGGEGGSSITTETRNFTSDNRTETYKTFLELLPSLNPAYQSWRQKVGGTYYTFGTETVSHPYYDSNHIYNAESTNVTPGSIQEGYLQKVHNIYVASYDMYNKGRGGNWYDPETDKLATEQYDPDHSPSSVKEYGPGPSHKRDIAISEANFEYNGDTVKTRDEFYPYTVQTWTDNGPLQYKAPSYGLTGSGQLIGPGHADYTDLDTSYNEGKEDEALRVKKVALHDIAVTYAAYLDAYRTALEETDDKSWVITQKLIQDVQKEYEVVEAQYEDMWNAMVDIDGFNDAWGKLQNDRANADAARDDAIKDAETSFLGTVAALTGIVYNSIAAFISRWLTELPATIADTFRVLRDALPAILQDAMDWYTARVDQALAVWRGSIYGCNGFGVPYESMADRAADGITDPEDRAAKKGIIDYELDLIEGFNKKLGQANAWFKANIEALKTLTEGIMKNYLRAYINIHKEIYGENVKDLEDYMKTALEFSYEEAEYEVDYAWELTNEALAVFNPTPFGRAPVGPFLLDVLTTTPENESTYNVWSDIDDWSRRSLDNIVKPTFDKSGTPSGLYGNADIYYKFGARSASELTDGQLATVVGWVDGAYIKLMELLFIGWEDPINVWHGCAFDQYDSIMRTIALQVQSGAGKTMMEQADSMAAAWNLAFYEGETQTQFYEVVGQRLQTLAIMGELLFPSAERGNYTPLYWMFQDIVRSTNTNQPYCLWNQDGTRWTKTSNPSQALRSKTAGEVNDMNLVTFYSMQGDQERNGEEMFWTPFDNLKADSASRKKITSWLKDGGASLKGSSVIGSLDQAGNLRVTPTSLSKEAEAQLKDEVRDAAREFSRVEQREVSTFQALSILLGLDLYDANGNLIKTKLDGILASLKGRTNAQIDSDVRMLSRCLKRGIDRLQAVLIMIGLEAQGISLEASLRIHSDAQVAQFMSEYNKGKDAKNQIGALGARVIMMQLMMSDDCLDMTALLSFASSDVSEFMALYNEGRPENEKVTDHIQARLMILQLLLSNGLDITALISLSSLDVSKFMALYNEGRPENQRITSQIQARLLMLQLKGQGIDLAIFLAYSPDPDTLSKFVTMFNEGKMPSKQISVFGARLFMMQLETNLKVQGFDLKGVCRDNGSIKWIVNKNGLDILYDPESGTMKVLGRTNLPKVNVSPSRRVQYNKNTYEYFSSEMGSDGNIHNLFVGNGTRLDPETGEKVPVRIAIKINSSTGEIISEGFLSATGKFIITVKYRLITEGVVRTTFFNKGRAFLSQTDFHVGDLSEGRSEVTVYDSGEENVLLKGDVSDGGIWNVKNISDIKFIKGVDFRNGYSFISVGGKLKYYRKFSLDVSSFSAIHWLIGKIWADPGTKERTDRQYLDNSLGALLEARGSGQMGMMLAENFSIGARMFGSEGSLGNDIGQGVMGIGYACYGGAFLFGNFILMTAATPLAVTGVRVFGGVIGRWKLLSGLGALLKTNFISGILGSYIAFSGTYALIIDPAFSMLDLENVAIVRDNKGRILLTARDVGDIAFAVLTLVGTAGLANKAGTITNNFKNLIETKAGWNVFLNAGLRIASMRTAYGIRAFLAQGYTIGRISLVLYVVSKGIINPLFTTMGITQEAFERISKSEGLSRLGFGAEIGKTLMEFGKGTPVEAFEKSLGFTPVFFFIGGPVTGLLEKLPVVGRSLKFLNAPEDVLNKIGVGNSSTFFGKATNYGLRSTFRAMAATIDEGGMESVTGRASRFGLIGLGMSKGMADIISEQIAEILSGTAGEITPSRGYVSGMWDAAGFKGKLAITAGGIGLVAIGGAFALGSLGIIPSLPTLLGIGSLSAAEGVATSAITASVKGIPMFATIPLILMPVNTTEGDNNPSEEQDSQTPTPSILNPTQVPIAPTVGQANNYNDFSTTETVSTPMAVPVQAASVQNDMPAPAPAQSDGLARNNTAPRVLEELNEREEAATTHHVATQQSIADGANVFPATPTSIAPQLGNVGNAQTPLTSTPQTQGIGPRAATPGLAGSAPIIMPVTSQQTTNTGTTPTTLAQPGAPTIAPTSIAPQLGNVGNTQTPLTSTPQTQGIGPRAATPGLAGSAPIIMPVASQQPTNTGTTPTTAVGQAASSSRVSELLNEELEQFLEPQGNLSLRNRTSQNRLSRAWQNLKRGAISAGLMTLIGFGSNVGVTQAASETVYTQQTATQQDTAPIRGAPQRVSQREAKPTTQDLSALPLSTVIAIALAQQGISLDGNNLSQSIAAYGIDITGITPQAANAELARRGVVLSQAQSIAPQQAQPAVVADAAQDQLSVVPAPQNIVPQAVPETQGAQTQQTQLAPQATPDIATGQENGQTAQEKKIKVLDEKKDNAIRNDVAARQEEDQSLGFEGEYLDQGDIDDPNRAGRDTVNETESDTSMQAEERPDVMHQDGDAWHHIGNGIYENEANVERRLVNGELEQPFAGGLPAGAMSWETGAESVSATATPAQPGVPSTDKASDNLKQGIARAKAEVMMTWGVDPSLKEAAIKLLNGVIGKIGIETPSDIVKRFEKVRAAIRKALDNQGKVSDFEKKLLNTIDEVSLELRDAVQTDAVEQQSGQETQLQAKPVMATPVQAGKVSAPAAQTRQQQQSAAAELDSETTAFENSFDSINDRERKMKFDKLMNAFINLFINMSDNNALSASEFSKAKQAYERFANISREKVRTRFEKGTSNWEDITKRLNSVDGFGGWLETIRKRIAKGNKRGGAEVEQEIQPQTKPAPREVQPDSRTSEEKEFDEARKEVENAIEDLEQAVGQDAKEKAKIRLEEAAKNFDDAASKFLFIEDKADRNVGRSEEIPVIKGKILAATQSATPTTSAKAPTRRSAPPTVETEAPEVSEGAWSEEVLQDEILPAKKFTSVEEDEDTGEFNDDEDTDTEAKIATPPASPKTIDDTDELNVAEDTESEIIGDPESVKDDISAGRLNIPTPPAAVGAPEKSVKERIKDGELSIPDAPEAVGARERVKKRIEAGELVIPRAPVPAGSTVDETPQDQTPTAEEEPSTQPQAPDVASDPHKKEIVKDIEEQQAKEQADSLKNTVKIIKRNARGVLTKKEVKKYSKLAAKNQRTADKWLAGVVKQKADEYQKQVMVFVNAILQRLGLNEEVAERIEIRIAEVEAKRARELTPTERAEVEKQARIDVLQAHKTEVKQALPGLHEKLKQRAKRLGRYNKAALNDIIAESLALSNINMAVTFGQEYFETQLLAVRQMSHGRFINAPTSFGKTKVVAATVAVFDLLDLAKQIRVYIQSEPKAQIDHDGVSALYDNLGIGHAVIMDEDRSKSSDDPESADAKFRNRRVVYVTLGLVAAKYEEQQTTIVQEDLALHSDAVAIIDEVDSAVLDGKNTEFIINSETGEATPIEWAVAEIADEIAHSIEDQGGKVDYVTEKQVRDGKEVEVRKAASSKFFVTTTHGLVLTGAGRNFAVEQIKAKLAAKYSEEVAEKILSNLSPETVEAALNSNIMLQRGIDYIIDNENGEVVLLNSGTDKLKAEGRRLQNERGIALDVKAKKEQAEDLEDGKLAGGEYEEIAIKGSGFTSNTIGVREVLLRAHKLIIGCSGTAWEARDEVRVDYGAETDLIPHHFALRRIDIEEDVIDLSSKGQRQRRARLAKELTEDGRTIKFNVSNEKELEALKEALKDAGIREEDIVTGDAETASDSARVEQDLDNLFGKVIIDTTYQRGFDINLIKMFGSVKNSLEKALKKAIEIGDTETRNKINNLIRALDMGLLRGTEENDLLDIIDRLRTDDVWFDLKARREAVQELFALFASIKDRAIGTPTMEEAADFLEKLVFAAEIYGISGESSHVGVREDRQIEGRLGRMNVTGEHQFAINLEENSADMAVMKKALMESRVKSRRQNWRDQRLCTSTLNARNRLFELFGVDENGEATRQYKDLSDAERREANECMATVREAMKRALPKQERVNREARERSNPIREARENAKEKFLKKWRAELKDNQEKLLRDAVSAVTKHYLESGRTLENFERLGMALEMLFGIQFNGLESVPAEELVTVICEQVQQNLSQNDLMNALRKIADVSLAAFLDTAQEWVSSGMWSVKFRWKMRMLVRKSVKNFHKNFGKSAVELSESQNFTEAERNSIRETTEGMTALIRDVVPSMIEGIQLREALAETYAENKGEWWSRVKKYINSKMPWYSGSYRTTEDLNRASIERTYTQPAHASRAQVVTQKTAEVAEEASEKPTITVDLSATYGEAKDVEVSTEVEEKTSTEETDIEPEVGKEDGGIKLTKEDDNFILTGTTADGKPVRVSLGTHVALEYRRVIQMLSNPLMMMQHNARITDRGVIEIGDVAYNRERVAAGAIISNSRLGDNVSVEIGAYVDRVIANNGNIGEGAKLDHVSADKLNIGENATVENVRTSVMYAESIPPRTKVVFIPPDDRPLDRFFIGIGEMFTFARDSKMKELKRGIVIDIDKETAKEEIIKTLGEAAGKAVIEAIAQEVAERKNPSTAPTLPREILNGIKIGGPKVLKVALFTVPLIAFAMGAGFIGIGGLVAVLGFGLTYGSWSALLVGATVNIPLMLFAGGNNTGSIFNKVLGKMGKKDAPVTQKDNKVKRMVSDFINGAVNKIHNKISIQKQIDNTINTLLLNIRTTKDPNQKKAAYLILSNVINAREDLVSGKMTRKEAQDAMSLAINLNEALKKVAHAEQILGYEVMLKSPELPEETKKIIRDELPGAKSQMEEAKKELIKIYRTLGIETSDTLKIDQAQPSAAVQEPVVAGKAAAIMPLLGVGAVGEIGIDNLLNALEDGLVIVALLAAVVSIRYAVKWYKARPEKARAVAQQDVSRTNAITEATVASGMPEATRDFDGKLVARKVKDILSGMPTVAGQMPTGVGQFGGPTVTGLIAVPPLVLTKPTTVTTEGELHAEDLYPDARGGVLREDMPVTVEFENNTYIVTGEQGETVVEALRKIAEPEDLAELEKVIRQFEGSLPYEVSSTSLTNGEARRLSSGARVVIRNGEILDFSLNRRIKRSDMGNVGEKRHTHFKPEGAAQDTFGTEDHRKYYGDILAHIAEADFYRIGPEELEPMYIDIIGKDGRAEETRKLLFKDGSFVLQNLDVDTAAVKGEHIFDITGIKVLTSAVTGKRSIAMRVAGETIEGAVSFRQVGTEREEPVYELRVEEETVELTIEHSIATQPAGEEESIALDALLDRIETASGEDRMTGMLGLLENKAGPLEGRKFVVAFDIGIAELDASVARLATMAEDAKSIVRVALIGDPENAEHRRTADKIASPLVSDKGIGTQSERIRESMEDRNVKVEKIVVVLYRAANNDLADTICADISDNTNYVSVNNENQSLSNIAEVGVASHVSGAIKRESRVVLVGYKDPDFIGVMKNRLKGMLIIVDNLNEAVRNIFQAVREGLTGM
ncbi:MAG: hypothetical protein ABID09_08570 [Candidatus Omnitrophota bacterium]